MGLLRRRWVWIVLGVVVLVVAVALAVLPEVVRRVALSQIPKLTGRAASIEDVDLNVFTGRLALTGFKLAKRDSPEPALEFRQLAVTVSPLALIGGHARVRDLTLASPRIHVVRTDRIRFDFFDLLELIPPPDPSKPSTTVVTVERLAVTDGRVIVDDRVASPPGRWQLEGLTVEGAGITTAPSAPPGRLTVKTTLNDAAIDIDATRVALDPLAIAAKVTLEGFRLPPLAPYVPAEIRILPRDGVLGTALALELTRGPDGAPRGTVSGGVRLDALALVERERPEAFLTLERLALNIKQIDLATRVVTVGGLEIDTPALKATRTAAGAIDLLALVPAGTPASTPPAPTPGGAPASGPRSPAPSTAPPTPSGAGAPPGGGAAPSAAAPAVSLILERLALTNGGVQFRDEHVSPVTTLDVKDLTVTVRDFTWPTARPANLDVAMVLPGQGRLSIKGTGTAAPVAADIEMALRGASLAPYGPYIPVRARFAGTFSGDSRSTITIANGAVRATSKGNSVIENLAMTDPRRPGAAGQIMRIPRVTLAGVDFSWPGAAKVARVVIARPEVRIEREADGSIPLRALFGAEPSTAPPVVVKTAAPAAARPAAAPPSLPPRQGSAPASARPAAPALPLAVEIGAIVIEDGLVRFEDRTTKPPFAETISRLAVTVEKLSTAPGRRANLKVHGIVGGSAALEMKGEIAPLGTLYADLSGELRDFSLPAVSPYADSVISWIIQRGRLAARFSLKLVGDELTARNEIVVANLDVAPSQKTDEVQKRLGLPLGLIVSLIKDGQGRIVINVPVTGHLSDPKFDLGETIWTAVKNVLVNVLAAPFRAIGRLLTGKDNTVEKLSVEPVTFEPGSPDVPPAMAQHLVRVAGFLRGAPGITLALTPVLTEKDVESVRGQELTARLQKLQREKGLPSYAAAVTSEFRARFPDVKPPETVEEQLARLLAAEPVPEARVKELRTLRLQAVRDALVKSEGIAEARLRGGDAPGAVQTSGEGRVDFAIAQ